MTKPKRSKKDAAAKPETVFDETDTGKIKNRHKNVRVALNKLKKKLKYDELADRVLIDDKMVTDDYILADLKVKMSDEFEFQPAKDVFGEAIGEAARRNSFHPIRIYLDGLKWDGVERLDDWLHVYLGAEDNPFNQAVGRLWLVAAVRRVRVPGCKFDEMLVLEGIQGSEKSTAIKILAGGDEWFTDDLPFKEDSKVFIERCTGKWLIEFSELSGINKRDVEGIKATLSRTHDRARLAYGHLPTEKPRTGVFIGTTNSMNYLRDSTGNRRFWPVATGQINLDDLSRDRDQLWAEAAAAEKAGESIRLDQSLWSMAERVQQRRTAGDPWADDLIKIVDVAGGKSIKVRTADIWAALGIETKNRTQENNARVGAIMKDMDFERGSARFAGGTPTKAYKRREGGGDLITVKWYVAPDSRLEVGVFRASTTVATTEEIPF